MSRSKASAGQYILISRYIAHEGGSFDPHFNLRILQKKLPIIYTVKLVTFICGMEFCVLTINENAISYIYCF